MGRKLDTNTYLDAVCQMLTDGAKSVPVPVVGDSMRPFLQTGDFVHMDTAENIRRGDILLFQRPNGQYVLHRVVRKKPGGYWMLGDNQTVREPISGDQIRAKATSAKIRGVTVTADSLRWWMFAYPWRWLAPWRRQIAWLHNVTSDK